MEEIWKDIEGFEGIYQVSDLGRIKVLDRMIYNYQSGTAMRNGKMMKLGMRKRYINVQLTNNSNLKYFSVHRLVALHFVPNPEKKPHVNHINGIKTDNRAVNLEWCTPRENLIHAFKTGLTVTIKGEKHINSKITELQAKDIKYNHKDLTLGQVGKIYGVSEALVCLIRNGKSWKHI